MLSKVGAIYPKRDAVDIRIINDVKNSTGRIINSQQDVGGWESLMHLLTLTTTVCRTIGKRSTASTQITLRMALRIKTKTSTLT